MNSKKQEWRRVGIYLFFAFVPMWSMAILLNCTMGFERWFSDPKNAVLGIAIMAFPAIANVITRLITKEGTAGSLVRLNLKKGLKYYIFSVLIFIAIPIAQGLCLTVRFGGQLPHNGGILKMICRLVAAIFAAAPLAFYTFGEEFGWRGYLYPKLEKLVGAPIACILGGIIWGIWHIPLTAAGHNFGTDYSGAPFPGIIAMTLFCIAFGTVLMWFTGKSGTIYPACLMHSFYNNSSPLISAMFTAEGITAPRFTQVVTTFIPVVLAGIVCFVLIIGDGRKTSNAPDTSNMD